MTLDWNQPVEAGVVSMNNKVTLACKECGSRNYSTTSNKQTQTERLELKKYCSNCGAHTVHKETK
ncbi:hypothetical protein G3A_16675 [Bacillus sp. 17376]|uniref:Large ribosomal subunit protein bL33 n=1 Tax=Mesobacillus boroniphilus JCM 21738 TaxID=1294265 RepID=W4RSW2_9BACI|nr:hypothetical protein G3A_16675 [Bacillus sp. 17376]GAE47197.1 LSU ribosomal protein L33p [Mesobacillus boroniphilus JCM 21738]